jgi:hypothetical protein
MARTYEQISQQGLKALRKELGRSGTTRFLQQFDTGNGDYGRERHDWVDGMSMDDLREATQASGGRRRDEHRFHDW